MSISDIVNINPIWVAWYWMMVIQRISTIKTLSQISKNHKEVEEIHDDINKAITKNIEREK